VILADIGNSFAHIYQNGEICDLKIEDFFKKYKAKKLFFITVNKRYDFKNKLWINLEPYIEIEGSYESMGVDRKALILSKKDAIIIDAGSAITIDVVKNSKFIGGTILPGIWKIKECYAQISTALKIDNIIDINLNKLPKNSTKESVSYGIIAPIIALVNAINKDNLPIVCTGGDGKILAKYLNAKYEKDLIFKSLLKIVRRLNVNNSTA
jgi:type III pantothenate kinase